MARADEHVAVQRGDVWRIRRPSGELLEQVWLTRQPAADYAYELNKNETLEREINLQVADIGRCYREDMGGGRTGWKVEFRRYDTVDGPCLILTDDTDDPFYTLGIYDTRQEVPGGPEPIIERTRLRVTLASWDDTPGTVRERATPLPEVAAFVADRARFVYALATTDALETEASWEKEEDRRA